MFCQHRHHVVFFRPIVALHQQPQAIQLFNKLQARRNCSVNIHSYTPLVDALTRELRWQEAIMLFQEMEDRKIMPTVQCYTSVVRA